ncbi:MAG: DMT family transporter [Candidatus Stahlbacteria bacterium]|nr:MAG: DMT family transporter [Candidatus Stahlbacteria bacterium]
MENQKLAYIYALLSVMFWSTVASAFKITLRHLDFLHLVFYATIVSIIALFIILCAQKKLNLLKGYSKSDYLRSLLLGFLNPFLYYIILFKAYSILPAQEALSLNYLWPITLTLLSIPILKQKISLMSIFAIFISFIGVIVIATHGNILSLKFTNPLGVSLALSSTIIWSLFWIYNIKDRRDDVAKLFLNFLFGFIFILITLIVTKKLALPSVRGLFGATYTGLFEMGITFVLWLKALSLSRTTAKVSNLIYLSPFFSLVIIRFALGEEILFSTVIGLSLIISGILVQRKTF